MRKITDKDFDNKFRKAFDEMEVTPRADLFADIDKGLHQKKNKRLPFFIAAASIAAILSIALLWEMQLHEPIESQKVVTVNKNKTNAIHTPSIAEKMATPTQSVAKTKVQKASLKNSAKKILPKIIKQETQLVKSHAMKTAPVLIADKDTEKANLLPPTEVANNVAIQSNNTKEDIKMSTEERQIKVAFDSALVERATKRDLVASNNLPASQKRTRKTFLSGLFKNLKQKVSDITSEVVSSNSDSTTVNLGFVAITKYKN